MGVAVVPKVTGDFPAGFPVVVVVVVVLAYSLLLYDVVCFGIPSGLHIFSVSTSEEVYLMHIDGRDQLYHDLSLGLSHVSYQECFAILHVFC